MNLKRFYNNPEVKKVTLRFIVIFLVGLSIIFLGSYNIVKFINKTIYNQNLSIISEVIKGGSVEDVIKSFYELKDFEEIEEGKKVLESYGYGEDFSIVTNEITNSFYKLLLMIFIPALALYSLITYLMYMYVLKGIYKDIIKVVNCIEETSSGQFKNIEGKYEEGDMAVLRSSLNYMGDRVNNSIYLLNKEKSYLKDLLSDISHQLKTPLASLVMLNDIMMENDNMPIEDRKKFLLKSEEQHERMEWLIMNLLKVGRLEAGVIEFDIQNTELKDTLELSISSLNGEANIKNQKLLLTGDLDLKLKHDKNWLCEAISNIIKNAIEHTQEGGIIEVNVHKGKLIKTITIKDNGPGIPKELRKKVFERFYKGENSTNPKSIGIGLSLAKSIVEELGGNIKLESEEGRGTTFIITFLQ